MHPLFQPFLEQQRFVVLDGAMASELEKRGANLNHPLWSAKILLEEPELIFQVHLAYLEAGADIITSSSYQASLEGFKKIGVGEELANELFAKSTQLALDARKVYLEKASPLNQPLVACSIGPFGAFLADGSEYRGDYAINFEELKSFHRGRISILDKTGADLLFFETIPSFLEAQVIIDLLNDLNTQTPAVLSFSCQNGEKMNDGTPLVKAAQLVEKEEKVVALGINCTAPKHITSLLLSINQCCRKPLAVYPNSGELWNAESKTWQPNEPTYSTFANVDKWFEAGAKIIGGCCRTTPAQIKMLSEKK